MSTTLKTNATADPVAALASTERRLSRLVDDLREAEWRGDEKAAAQLRECVDTENALIADIRKKVVQSEDAKLEAAANSLKRETELAYASLKAALADSERFELELPRRLSALREAKNAAENAWNARTSDLARARSSGEARAELENAVAQAHDVTKRAVDALKAHDQRVEEERASLDARRREFDRQWSALVPKASQAKQRLGEYRSDPSVIAILGSANS